MMWDSLAGGFFPKSENASSTRNCSLQKLTEP